MPRVHIRLTTAIVLMLGAAVLLALNLTPRIETQVLAWDNREELQSFLVIPYDDRRLYPTVVEYRNWRAGWPRAMWFPHNLGSGLSRFEPILPATDEQCADFYRLKQVSHTSADLVERELPSLKPFIKRAPVTPVPPLRFDNNWNLDLAFFNAIVALAILLLLATASELFLRHRERPRNPK